jgi:hypothetical protein
MTMRCQSAWKLFTAGALALGLSGCASVAGGDTLPEGASVYRVVPAELLPLTGIRADEALIQLRPNWWGLRGPTARSVERFPQVYVDRVRGNLARYCASDIEGVEFLPRAAARNRLSVDHPDGVIVVQVVPGWEDHRPC